MYLNPHIKHIFSKHIRKRLIRLGYHSRPQFLIIGAQKAGTTALFYYLADHPDIVPASDKEIRFFAPEALEDLPGHPYHEILCPAAGPIYSNDAGYARAAAWYHGLFPLPHELGRRLTFEATPEYLYYPQAAERIQKYNPRAKLIVLLRDPVERAFSAWNMYQRFDDPVYCVQRETGTFEEAVAAELADIAAERTSPGPHYVRRGIYHEQLRRYFNLFDREQILVIDSRRLRSDTVGVLDEVVAFLGLPGFRRMGERPLIHVGTYEEEAPVTATRLLRGFYREHNQQLYKLQDHDFGWP
jgi:hypothetical protein